MNILFCAFLDVYNVLQKCSFWHLELRLHYLFCTLPSYSDWIFLSKSFSFGIGDILDLFAQLEDSALSKFLFPWERAILHSYPTHRKLQSSSSRKISSFFSFATTVRVGCTENQKNFSLLPNSLVAQTLQCLKVIPSFILVTGLDIKPL